MIGATICSGIGAPEVAMPWVDWVLASEIEKFPRALLQQRFGCEDAAKSGRTGPALWGDFTTLRARHFDRLGIPIPEIIVAGTPCQAFSIAGLRGGLDDARGNLTLSFVRLFDAIDNLRRHRGLAGLVGIWENVPGVLNHADNPFGCFLAAMAGCGAALVPPNRAGWTDAGMVVGPRRAIGWRSFDAQYFGLAQRRERVFAVIGPRDWLVADALFPVGEGLRRDTPPRHEARQAVAGSLSAGSKRSGGRVGRREAAAGHLVAGTLNANGKAAGSATQQDAETGMLVAYGGNNTSGPIEVATAVRAKGGTGHGDFESETFVTHALRADGFDASEDGTGRGTPIAPVSVFDPNQITSKTNRSRPTPGLSHTLPANGAPPVAFSAKDYGADAGELAPTLRAGGHKDSHPNAGVPPAAVIGEAVRRLTPRECERLQGFPDDWTVISYRGKPAADGPRYKAVGNSMPVPVLRWIGARIRLVNEQHRARAGVAD